MQNLKGPEKYFTYSVERYTIEQINKMTPMKFWCEQFAEHAVMIKTGLVGGREEINIIINNAENWFNYWKEIDHNNFNELKEGSSLFIDFKENLLELMQNMWTGYLLPSLIKHMISEVNHFLTYIDGTIIENNSYYIKFWCKHHEEFSTVFSKIIDPKEENTQKIIDEFKKYFKEDKELINNNTYFKEDKELINNNTYFENFKEDTKKFEEYIHFEIPPNIKNVIYPLLINHDYNELLFSIKELNF